MSSTKERAEAGEGDEEVGEEGAVDPVFEKRRQEEKGTAATECCNMVVFVYNNQTAVILTKRSSSYPCGLGLESLNLLAALPNVVTYGGSRPHIAPGIMIVYMPCSS